MEGTQSIVSGRMLPEHLRVTKAKTSTRSSKRSRQSAPTTYQFLDLRNGKTPEMWLEMDGVLRGESMTLNTGEFPSVARESTLSSILSTNVPEKYYLSQKAADGILRRAKKHGKQLPTLSLSLSLDPGASAESVAVFDARGNGDGVTVPTIVGDHENRVTDYTALIFYQAAQFWRFKESDICPTLCARDAHSFNHLLTWEDAFHQRRVRRLTPIECLRLQGLPDWWCDDVPSSDAAIYKMAGNGIAMPCVSDVFERIVSHERCA